MNELNFKQLEPGMADINGPFFQMSHPIATFPTYLRTRLPMDERYLYSALKNNLNGYLTEIEEYIKNPAKLKDIAREKPRHRIKIIKFDKIKLIELIFIGLYISSLILLINPVTFIYGFNMNIISIVAILILSFIIWEES